MRVVLVVPGFSAHPTDWCIPSLTCLVSELAREHQITVLSLRYPSPERTYRVHGAEVRALGGGERLGAGRLRLLARALGAVVAMRSLRPDVVHGLWADEPGFVATLGARFLRRPALVSLLGGELTALPEVGYGHALYRAPRWLIARSLASARRVTVGSESLLRLASASVESERLRLLPLGVDVARFTPRRSSGSERVQLAGAPALLQVAALTPVKGQDLLLRVLRELRARLPSAHLHLVGEGPQRAALEALADSLEVRERVTFHGDLRHERLPAVYRAADLHLISSHHESQCMAVLEAAACATPTVGVAVGVVPDLGRGAIAVDGRDPRAFADAIAHAVSTPGRLAELQRVGLEAVAMRYALPQTVEALVDLYRELALGRTADSV